MADNGKGGPQGGMGDEMTVAAVFVIAGLAIWLVWSQARNVIVYGAFGLNWLQFKALDYLGLLDAGEQQVLDDMQGYFDGRYDPFEVTWRYIREVETFVGDSTKWGMVGVMVALAVLCAFRMKGDGFKRQYTLTGKAETTVFRVAGMRIDNRLLRFVLRLLLTVTFLKGMLLVERKEWVTKGMSFMHFQAGHWKVALAGANFDPNKDDPDQAPQRTPLEWMRDNKVSLVKNEGMDEEAAELAFQKQLGPVWHGVESAPLHVQALCILAALNVKRDRNVNSLRDRLTEIYVLEGGKADAVKAAIAPYLANPLIVKAINKHGAMHGFVNSAAIGIYGWGGPMKEWGGGEAGVLATSMFRWLKKVDRTLWYALNNVGRRAFHIEGAGAVAHFFAERVVGAPLAEAHVDEAVEGLATYIEEQGIDDLETFFRVDKDF